MAFLKQSLFTLIPTYVEALVSLELYLSKHLLTILQFYSGLWIILINTEINQIQSVIEIMSEFPEGL